MKIGLLLDSSADLSLDEEEACPYSVIRFPLIIELEEYLEEKDISLEKVREYIHTETIIKTSQPSVGALTETWDQMLEIYDHIIYLPISSELSGAYKTALLYARDYKDKITVIDAHSVAFPQQIIAKEIVSMIDDGMAPHEIKAAVEDNEAMFALLIPENLNRLVLGGRISKEAAAMAQLLKIHPILSIEDGRIEAFSKVRTHKKAVKTAVNYFKELNINHQEYEFYVVYDGLKDEAVAIKDELEECFKTEVHLAPLRSIILTHTGLNTIGIGYIKKIRI